VLARGGGSSALDEHLGTLIREQQPDQTAGEGCALLDDANAVAGETIHVSPHKRLAGKSQTVYKSVGEPNSLDPAIGGGSNARPEDRTRAGFRHQR
jgi:hypothetical protein